MYNQNYQKFKEKIEEAVEWIYSTYKIEGPIKTLKDMENIVLKLGGYVKYDKYNKLLHNQVYKINDAFLIEVQPIEKTYSNHENYDENNKKFVIAQALGEVFLNMEYRNESGKWDTLESGPYNKFQKDDLDVEWINYFASAFLMPRKLFKHAMDACTHDNNKVNTRKMAEEYLYVNKSDVESRGVSLGSFR